MVRFRWIVIIGGCLLTYPFLAGTALAQDSVTLNPLVYEILVRISVIIDGALGHFVSGNTLTEYGGNLAGNIAQIVFGTTDVVAQFFAWLFGTVVM